MSIESPGKRYTPEEVAEFERTRIQDPEQAHEVANMFRFEAGENATPEEYDRALEYLTVLQEKAEKESQTKLDFGFRAAIAGLGTALDKVPKLVRAAIINFENPTSREARESAHEKIGGGLLEQLKNVGQDYEKNLQIMASARERLELWRKQSEEAVSKKKQD